jgi:hypothetical protein
VLEEWRTTNPATAVAGVRSESNQLTVFLSAAQPLTYFAAPALRLTKRGPEATWPLGTGPWKPRPDLSGSRLVATATVRDAERVLSFDLRLGADPRDLLDAAAHLLLTRDRGAISYAAGLSGWTDVPLGWDRVYLFLSPASTSSDAAVVNPIRAELARDALRGEGRPADSTLVQWIAGCTAASDAGPPRGVSVGRRRRVIYPREDAVARALAERLVARAESDLSALLGFPAVAAGTTITAVGLDLEQFTRVVAEREDMAVVMSLSHHGAFDCGPLAALGDGWGLVEPLVETRAHALVRTGAARVVNDRDGLVIEPAGPRR